jgi:recombination DNA repair RAD52 pathway protein
MAGEVVTQTLNDAFGYDGWSMEVRDKTREVRESCIFVGIAGADFIIGIILSFHFSCHYKQGNRER